MSNKKQKFEFKVDKTIPKTMKETFESIVQHINMMQALFELNKEQKDKMKSLLDNATDCYKISQQLIKQMEYFEKVAKEFMDTQKKHKTPELKKEINDILDKIIEHKTSSKKS